MSQTPKEQKQSPITASDLHPCLKKLCQENNAKDDWIWPILHGVATTYQIQQFLLVLHQDWETVDKSTRRELLKDVFRYFKEREIIYLAVAYPFGVAQFLRRYDVIKSLSFNDLNVFKEFFPGAYAHYANVTDSAQFSELLSDIAQSMDYLFLYQPILDEVEKSFKQQEVLLSGVTPLHHALISVSMLKSDDLNKLESIGWMIENKIAIDHITYNDQTSFDVLISIIKQNHKSEEGLFPNFAELSPIFQKIISLYDEHIGLENVIVSDEGNKKILTQIQAGLESARLVEASQALVDSTLMLKDVFGIVKEYLPKQISKSTEMAQANLMARIGRNRLDRGFVGTMGAFNDPRIQVLEDNPSGFFANSNRNPGLVSSVSSTVAETKSSQIEWNKPAVQHILGEVFPAYPASRWHVSLKDHAAWICFESEAERKAAFEAINIELLLNDSMIKVECGRDQNNGLKHTVILKEITPEALEKLRETPEAISTTTIGLGCGSLDEVD